MKYQLPTADAGAGLLVPSYAELTAQGTAPAAPTAGKARAYLDANGGLQLLPAAGILGRRVAVHWGTVTAWPPLAAAGDTCVRSDVGTAGSLWQYTGIASSGAAGWVAESPVVCTSSTRPTGTVLYDGLPIFQSDDKASATWDVANAIWHVWDSVDQTFTPVFVTAGGAPAVGNGTLTGRYRRMGRLCWLLIDFVCGSTTNMGTGTIQFNLPAAIGASAPAGTEQWVPCKAWTTGGNFGGLALLTGTAVLPWLPASATNGVLNNAASANAGGAGGTGTPLVAGQYTFGNGSNVHVEGTYEMTTG